MNEIGLSLDTVWMLLAAMLVFWMQPGFALCEAGFTRRKNAANILMKNFVDFMFGSLLFFFIGFGFMFGGDILGGFVGIPNWGDLSFYSGDLPVEGFLIFETVFCATAATIVSGAMAERTKFSMYLVYSAFISLIIYPVEGHWTWGGGWLCNDAADGFMMSTFGDVFHDFAGSAIVHSVGGVLAFVGAMALGPRLGKYSKDGKSRAIPGHNLALAALGVFILWLGWFGFNPGSQLAASGEVNRTAISHVFLTTNLAAVAGGVATMFVTWLKYGKPSLSLTLNGILAGLVGITAGCDLVSPVGAVIIGLVCGTVLVFAIEFIDHKLHIDDPVGASSVHGVCGILGTLMTGLLATENGAFYGGGWGFFGAECFGILMIDLWAAACGFVLFYGIKKLHGLRVDARIEEEGLDIYEHGESCYN
ncbi:MAG: ammonium transporter [Bacteroidaceae bacterium]|nr:ammonium transporter [Bacteroidaceae bacterium]